MNVLVPFDVHPVSERAVRYALEVLGPRSDVHITAVHMTTGVDEPAKGIAASEIEKMAEEYDATVEAEVRSLGYGDESKGAIREAISEFAKERDVDLVVIGHEQKSLFQQLFGSDTTERMLEEYEIPVLLVP